MALGSARLITLSANAAERAGAAAWANARIGLPWVDGAEGPRAFGCWGLVRDGLKALAGLDVPTAPIGELIAVLARREVRREWRPSDRLSHLAICVTGSAHHRQHVGLALGIDRGIIVHAVQDIGVLASSELAMRAMGFQHLRYLVHAPAEHSPAMAQAAA